MGGIQCCRISSGFADMRHHRQLIPTVFEDHGNVHSDEGSPRFVRYRARDIWCTSTNNQGIVVSWTLIWCQLWGKMARGIVAKKKKKFMSQKKKKKKNLEKKKKKKKKKK